MSVKQKLKVVLVVFPCGKTLQLILEAWIGVLASLALRQAWRPTPKVQPGAFSDHFKTRM